jgi:hypothetical protein
MNLINDRPDKIGGKKRRILLHRLWKQNGEKSGYNNKTIFFKKETQHALNTQTGIEENDIGKAWDCFKKELREAVFGDITYLAGILKYTFRAVRRLLVVDLRDKKDW